MYVLTCAGTVYQGGLVVETSIGDYWVQINSGGATVNFTGARCSTGWTVTAVQDLPVEVPLVGVFDWQTAAWASTAVVVMFSVGVGIGLILQQVRKLR